jgi:hypothetical protein
MQFRLIRCLAVLLSLALANGNAHAALHSGAAHSEPCPQSHAHHGGHAPPHHQHQSDNGGACCCDCLGCGAGAQVPTELAATPIEFASRIRFDALTAALSSRAVPPEPDPPRPGTLS